MFHRFKKKYFLSLHIVRGQKHDEECALLEFRISQYALGQQKLFSFVHQNFIFFQVFFRLNFDFDLTLRVLHKLECIRQLCFMDIRSVCMLVSVVSGLTKNTDSMVVASFFVVDSSQYCKNVYCPLQLQQFPDDFLDPPSRKKQNKSDL